MTREQRKKAIRRRRIFLAVCAVILTGLIALIVWGASAISHVVRQEDKKQDTVSEKTSSTEKEPVKLVSSATVINTGDILIHNPVLNGAKSGDTYDFSAFFPLVKPYITAADYAVINLEVTLGGPQAGSYKGYPAFNTPDVLIDELLASGFSMVLTANNHSYDTGLYGMKRTVQVLKEKKMDYIGTRETAAEPNYLVKTVNGIRIGMACFTYENTSPTPGRKSLNGNLIAEEANALINSFAYEQIDSFYTDAENMVKAMKKDGADAIVFYMHWGNEYKLKEDTWQRTIAQKLCNMGVDVIVGGHPHVIEPMALLHAEDSENTTVCLYSMGNSVSNQRREELGNLSPNGHTEDGVLFSYTFDRYSDGKTVLSAVDAIPTWVDKYRGGSGWQYKIIPLESPNDGSQKYGLSGSSAQKAAESYARTKGLLAEGLTECQTALGCKVRFAEATPANP
ncbi:MAG: CapA family protein [Clostridia bacterium]|nr:CapA family protein [Clostridia bacterium]